MPHTELIPICDARDVARPSRSEFVRAFIETTESTLELLGLRLDEKTGEYYYDEVTVKRWITEPGATQSGPCEICDDNEAQGWIDMDDLFDSGDDEPPGHPNCACTVEYKDTRKRVYV